MTNISLQTHVPQSSHEGNKHVFKMNNLLDHQMPMDGDDAILGFKLMDEEKKDNPDNIHHLENELCLVTCCTKLDLVAFDLVMHKKYIEFLCGTYCKLV